MKFMCLGSLDPAKMAGYTEADVEALTAQCRPHLERLYASGHLICDAGLAEEAKSMRRQGGKVSVVDGPF